MTWKGSTIPMSPLWLFMVPVSLFVGCKALLCHGQRTHSSSPRSALLNRNTHAIVYPGREKKKSCWFVCLDLEILNCFEKPKTQFEYRTDIYAVGSPDMLLLRTFGIKWGRASPVKVWPVWFVPPPAVFSVSHLIGSSLQGEKVSLAPPAVF